MASAYHATRNPSLIQQLDKLSTEAVQCGLRAQEAAPRRLAIEDLEGSTELMSEEASASFVRPRRGSLGRDASH
jgi:hypothetical protein